MPTLQEISRVQKIGGSRYLNLPKKLFDFLGWREDDRVVLSASSTQITVKRIPMEQFASSAARAEGEGQ